MYMYNLQDCPLIVSQLQIYLLLEDQTFVIRFMTILYSMLAPKAPQSQ